MVQSIDLTIRRIRNSRNLDESNFADLYAKLITGAEMTDTEYVDILRFGVLMSRSSDDAVRRLGYRIFLQYGEVTGDYEPLREIAQARDLIPLVAAIERIHPDLDEDTSLARVFFAAHTTNFEEPGPQHSIYRTRGQMELREFNSRESEAIIVAPTSYGKSEMLINKVASGLPRRTCVLVPSRALIAQTRANIIANDQVRSSRVRIITHPDAFNGDDHFIAVMTQERLQRLLVDNPNLLLDQLLVDEAHNLLSGDSRSVDLSQVILICRHRNPDLAITYYTPFIASPESLRHIDGFDQSTRVKSVNEHVKIERFMISAPGEYRRLYDQFLNETFRLNDEVPADEVAAVLQAGGDRTLVYVNRPKDAQSLAERLASERSEAELSDASRRAIAAISDLIDPRYGLIEAIKHGVMFHHGQVPDSLRLYIEELFRNDNAPGPRFLVTTSTLLEGVNTPADRLIMMTGTRGRSNLSRSEFRNLVGRIGRFRELFSPDRRDLALLQPRIHLIPSSYARRNWNVDSFLSSVADASSVVEDDVRNPLLENAKDVSDRHAKLEFLENIEPGIANSENVRSATTEVGQLCFRHGVHDFDTFEVENTLQARIDGWREGGPINEVKDLINAVVNIFFKDIELQRSDDLVRLLEHDEARDFYTMFLDWRSRSEPFRRMVSHFVGYWSGLDSEYVYVGPRWGEVRYNGPRELWVQVRTKTEAQLVNLAVVKIKEEQDFVDFRLLKYVEILFRLDLLDKSLYFRIKYGTDDEYLICLLRNGFSPELARLVKEHYRRLVSVDTRSNRVQVQPELPRRMVRDNQNDILAYEARTLVNAGVEPIWTP